MSITPHLRDGLNGAETLDSLRFAVWAKLAAQKLTRAATDFLRLWGRVKAGMILATTGHPKDVRAHGREYVTLSLRPACEHFEKEILPALRGMQGTFEVQITGAVAAMERIALNFVTPPDNGGPHPSAAPPDSRHASQR